jgi:hypothetical protein
VYTHESGWGNDIGCGGNDSSEIRFHRAGISYGNDRCRGTMHRAQKEQKMQKTKKGTIHCAPTKRDTVDKEVRKC